MVGATTQTSWAPASVGVSSALLPTRGSSSSKGSSADPGPAGGGAAKGN